jgi:hypothetical protein
MLEPEQLTSTEKGPNMVAFEREKLYSVFATP